jgi:hypothetical protein
VPLAFLEIRIGLAYLFHPLLTEPGVADVELTIL